MAEVFPLHLLARRLLIDCRWVWPSYAQTQLSYKKRRTTATVRPAPRMLVLHSLHSRWPSNRASVGTGISSSFLDPVAILTDAHPSKHNVSLPPVRSDDSLPR